MKSVLKAYIWIVYIISLPVFLVYSLILIIHAVYANVRDLGEADVTDTIKAYVSGCIVGHKINMARIEDIYSDDDGCKEEGL